MYAVVEYGINYAVARATHVNLSRHCLWKSIDGRVWADRAVTVLKSNAYVDVGFWCSTRPGVGFTAVLDSKAVAAEKPKTHVEVGFLKFVRLD